jgi:Ca2+-binding RTX toxin-like protein
MDYTFAFAGQSNAWYHFDDDRSGESYKIFEQVLEQDPDIGNVTALDTADGGRSADILARRKPNNWHWDPDNNLPNDFLRDAVITMKNQHADGVIWAQGEADARSLAGNSPNGQTTTARFEEATTEIFQYIRDQLNDPDLPIFIQQLGNVTSSDYVGGIDAMRAVQQHIADTDDNVFIAAITTDLAMSSDHLHFSQSSYETIAGRLATFVGNYIDGNPGGPIGGGGGGGGSTTPTNGNDNLVFGSGNDLIKALAGNDTIDGGGGGDTIIGGAGADAIVLRLGDGRDVINDFERGVDTIVLDGFTFGDVELIATSSGTNVKAGGTTLASFKGVALSADDFDDAAGGGNPGGGGGGGNPGDGGGSTTPTNGNDNLVFGGGDDLIKALGGDDTIDGGGGGDTIIGGAGADDFVLRLGDGRDVINDFERGVDKIVLDGFSFGDVQLIATSSGTNVKAGGTTLASFKGVALSADDFGSAAPAGGNPGNPGTGGGTGSGSRQVIEGTSGDDSLPGSGDDDYLIGLGGNDTIRGGDGNDVIDGGPGTDIINGSDGADIIVVRAGQLGNDKINDFQDGVDKIVLAGDLTFGDLDIADINGWAQLSVGGENLAKFKGISASQLTGADVIAASEVPPPDGLSWADPDNLLL